MTQSLDDPKDVSSQPLVYYTDPYKHQKVYQKRRYAEDEEYRAHKNAQRLEYERRKYATDPAYRQRQNEKSRKRYHDKKVKKQLEMSASDI